MCPPNGDVTVSAIYKCHWGRAADGRGAPGIAQRRAAPTRKCSLPPGPAAPSPATSTATITQVRRSLVTGAHRVELTGSSAPLASSRRWVSSPRSLPGACGSSCQPQRSAAPRSSVPSSTAVHSSAPRRRSSNASLVETICRVQAWPSSRSPAIAAIRVGHLARVSWPAATRVRSTPFPIGGIACIAQTIAAILLPSGFCPHLVLPSSLATRWIHKRLRPLNSFWASS